MQRDFLCFLCFFLLFSSFGRTINPLKFTQISTTFNKPIAIEFHEPTNNVIVTNNYPSGKPYNFKRIDSNGNQYQFSSAANFGNEIKMALVRPDATGGGFIAGDLFTGNGRDGEVLRVTDNGNRVVSTWCRLPGAGSVGLLRGSLHVDRTGVWGYDLIVVTTRGFVFRVQYGDNQCAGAQQIASVGVHLEGMITLPNDPKYGELAGKIIAGAEQQRRLYAFATDKTVKYWSVPVAIEDLDLIEPNENFFGVNYGTGKILGVEAKQWKGSEGKILATQESPGTLWELFWDGSKPAFIKIETASDSPNFPGQWEHVTFAPAGINELLPTDFSLCIKAKKNGNNDLGDVHPVKMQGTATSIGNYAYGLGGSFSTSASRPAPQPNTLLVYFTQDYRNEFTLTFVANSRTGGSAGSATLEMSAVNFGNSRIWLQDDPPTISSTIDFPDLYTQTSVNGVQYKKFQWRWGPQTTDGAIVGDLNLIDSKTLFKLDLHVSSSSGLTQWKLITQASNGDLQEYTLDIADTLTLERIACPCTADLTTFCCGDGVKDKLEECDGGECCDQCAFKPSTYPCRGIQGDCDVVEYCTGNSASCPKDEFLVDNANPCRGVSGVCDTAEYCDGTSASCPSDKVLSGDICRPSLSFCDVEEVCDGVNKDCPLDSLKPVGTPCDDSLNCTQNESCTSEGLCRDPDEQQNCEGICGDGVLGQHEACDYSVGNSTCCSLDCKPLPSGFVCRESNGDCDKEEVCNGVDATCPPDEKYPTNYTCLPKFSACQYEETCDGTSDSCPPCIEHICNQFTTCDQCSNHPECGWCCEGEGKGSCHAGTQTGPDVATCDFTWQFEECGCGVTCVNGSCICGTCECDPPYFEGENCAYIRDCNGTLRLPNDPDFQRIDQCGVCGGNDTTCIGCDGVLNSGKVVDNCGVCGGDGTSCWKLCNYDSCGSCTNNDGVKCIWCAKGADKGKCFEKNHLDDIDCDGYSENGDCDFILGLSVAEAAGIGAGIIAVIVIASVAAVILLGVGGKKGYDYWKGKDNKLGEVQDNPLYENNLEMEGENPLYSESRLGSI